MSEPPVHVEPLRYDVQQPAVSRRGFRFLLFLTLVNTIMLAAFIAGPAAQMLMKQQWASYQQHRASAKRLREAQALQQQCMTYEFPPDQIAYAEDPAGVEQMNATSRTVPAGTPISRYFPHRMPDIWSDPVALAPPKSVDQLERIVGVVSGPTATQRGGLVYLHERRTPSGKPRLVAIRVLGEPSIVGALDLDRTMANTVVNMTRQLFVLVSEPAAPDSGGGISMRRASTDLLTFDSTGDDATLVTAGTTRDSTIKPVIEPHSVLRLYAGQSDPNDATRFTIPYELDGARGSIAGFVLEESVKLDVVGPLRKLRRPLGRQAPGFLPAPSPTVRRARPSAAASRPSTNR